MTSIQEGQDYIDAVIAKYGAGTREDGPEKMVLVPIEMWREVEWLEDGPLDDAIQATDDDAYAEGEEMGPFYVFFVGGAYVTGERTLEDLQGTVQAVLDARAAGRYTATINRERVLIGATP